MRGARGDRAAVQDEFSGLAELAVPHHQQAMLLVEVDAIEHNRFTDTHPGDGE